jgi:lauroyl/myristoyl acyltransferase
MSGSIAERAEKRRKKSDDGQGVSGESAPAVQKPLSAWDRASFALAHGATSALLLVLGLNGLYRFGQAFGTLEWSLNYKRRRKFARAMKRIWGRKPTARERRLHTRRFFMRTRCDKLFYLIFDRIPRDRAAALLTFSDKAVLDEALANGRGIYLAMSHHGAQHVLGMLLALLGYKPAAVRDRNESGLRRFVQARFDEKYPEFGRMRVLYADSYPREIFRCLEEGYIVGSAMDVSRVRADHQKFEEVTIFGERRPFLSGPVSVAMRRKTAVLQAFVVSQPGFRYRMEIVETLYHPKTDGDDAATLSRAMQTYAANVERFVTQSPSQLSRI